ncbi:transient receptor potential cation channel subfamily V member 1-like [Epinephelus moara]|uniref:transient receptor potential cation channel subfamily V member 1-like n=1 Tax=Epinephelus moara TaxID=300413 RepID=UPI00214E04C6|nr:transient receptor potential cation channel subfamily V member 1-like [Epinephelus moara]XP_049895884.1 transient receptor potential cation channel subfamily V member 1-like [Epinephelus moara]
MDDGQPTDKEEPTISQEEEGNGLDWLLRTDSSEIIPAPMDTNVLLARECDTTDDSINNKEFTRERVFEAASQGDTTELVGLLDYLRVTKKKLTSPEFTDETNGKTALLKALMNLKDGKNDTIEVLLDIAEKTGDLENFINASYQDPCYNGQTALHIAIERRSFDHVKLLVQKGADVQAKANGKFFQRNAGLGFYFGELPLSLAACTNQPDVVAFLMENPYTRADVADKDLQGNTVLHALVVIADNTDENTEMIAKMYDEILTQHSRLEKKTIVQLEEIENDKGLTPLKLAAKLGKIGLFKHMLHREFVDEEMRPLSRKFTEWVYGPVHSSLYDLSSIDTNEKNSVLEIVVFSSEIPNRPEMLQIEPLRSLLQNKWDRFASKLFLMNFLVYLVYLIIFTTVAFYRKEGQPPFPVDNVPLDHVRCIGEVISVLGAVWFFYKAITIFKRNPPTFKALYTTGFCDILFFLQAALILVCTVLYFCGRKEYVGLLVLALALAWINVLYYSRGSKQMGMYSVMMERIILGDLLHFLCVYGVLLFGFSAAVVAVIRDSPPACRKVRNGTLPHGSSPVVKTLKCKKSSYNDIRFATLEMFKFTIGMGDLQFTDHVQYKEVFYVLLISYIVITYILLLNMLIALMGYTVERVSKQIENIWNLQRASTILDMEGTLPRCLVNKLHSGMSKMVRLKNEEDESRQFFRVEEINWKKWRSDVGVVQDEDPGESMMKPLPHEHTPRSRWHINPLLKRIRARHHQPQLSSVPDAQHNIKIQIH